MKNIAGYINQYPKFWLVLLILVGIYLRFFNLNWGAPYYFHPDERNIASSVIAIRFPEQMNPRFFAYGTLPIYAIYSIGVIRNIFGYCLFLSPTTCLPADITAIEFMDTPLWQTISQNTFEQAIIVSRIFSAALSVLLIPLMYLAGKELHSKQAGILTAFMSATGVGLIQFAHFGTFEIWITFFSVLLFIVCLRLLKMYKTKLIIFAAVFAGILVAIKISNVVLISIPLFGIALALHSDLQTNARRTNNWLILSEYLTQIITVIIIAGIVFVLTNPFVILDFPAFENSMNYESGVAMGTLPVFYTQEFFGTLPVIFHFSKILPFLINPLLTLLFIVAFVFIFRIILTTKNKSYLLLLFCFLVIFLPQAFLFVKWTRYMVPALPFMYLIIAITITDFSQKIKSKSLLNYTLYSILIVTCCIFAYSYFRAVLSQPDTRVAAAGWGKTNLETNNNAISELYDLGIIAFNGTLPHISLCDFYNLELTNLPCNGKPLQESLDQSTYIILPSERIAKMSFINEKKFPDRHKFYRSLYNDKGKYRILYETPCDLYCRILYLGDPTFSLEQTVNVFDRPTIRIFQIL